MIPEIGYNMDSQVVFDRNVVEFVTVAAEYCVFVEQIGGKERLQACDILLKLLPLLYLKASMLPVMESDETISLAKSVTEPDYEYIRGQAATLMGPDDDYLEVFTEEMKYCDVPVRKTISEDLADIYQPLKNFIESFRTGINPVMAEAAANCRQLFMEGWGQTLLNTMRAIHSFRYAPLNTFDEDNYD